MVEYSEMDAESQFLITHLNKINESTDSFSSFWFLERHCPEFSKGEWIDPAALLTAKYPDLDLNNEKDVLEKGTWESSALILERHYPDEFGYREWKPLNLTSHLIQSSVDTHHGTIMAILLAKTRPNIRPNLVANLPKGAD